MNHAVPEHPVFRPGTVDREIWQEAVEGNCYKLPYLFAPGDNVLNVGAHTGSVAWRCAMSGAKVVAVEPSRENFHLLVHNLRPVWDRVLPVSAAVWRSDKAPCVVPFQPNWTPANTGGGCTMNDAGTAVAHQCLALPLDDLLRLEQRWRMVVIDCEGAEFVILGTSKELARCACICGEYHERDGTLPFATGPVPCRMADLAAHLSAQGFAVEVEAKGAEGRVGLFWARGAGA